MDTPWRIEMLGGLRAVQGDRVMTRFRTQKTGLLLAYLAYYPYRSHPREALIDLLWSESDIAAGRQSLSQALSSLRRQLEPPGVPTGSVLIADRACVQLSPAAVTTDVAAFREALRAASRAGSSTERTECLAHAVDLDRGELLRGHYDDWILGEREGLAELYFQALGQLLAQLEEAGDWQRALQYARQGVNTDPLREEAHVELMRLASAAGQPAIGLRQYGELERILKEELGATPTAATRALARELERQARGGEMAPVSLSPRTASESPAPSWRDDDSLPPVPSATRTVTFLLVEVGSSSEQDQAPAPEGWGAAAAAFTAAVARRHARLRRLLREHGGREVRADERSVAVAFSCASDALAAAIASQRAVTAGFGPEGAPQAAWFDGLRVRMALDTGEVAAQDGVWYGAALPRAARLLLAAHGGQILCSEETAILLRRVVEPGVRLVGLGPYRLPATRADGLPAAAPERLFQIEYPGMERQEFPPPNAEAGYLGNLPLSFTRFFGREQEVARLEEMLLGADTRLLTLTGPGGSGKTRLALEVARRLVDWWRGAVWFVPLADLSDARLIAGAVLKALRVPQSGGVDPLEQATAALSHQPALLLLDNFEHLVGDGAPLVRALLERVSSLTCLVTSRQRLALAGEREFHVLPLPTPDEGDAPEQLIQCESVQLFLDRAQAVRPDFQVTAANASAVAAVCHRLEGMPLALVLAAARAQVLTPAQMLARLADRYDFLVSRQRDATARHRSLRAAIDWSYRLLSPEVQRFFAQLSVFRGGWTLNAAETVCEEPLALDYLEQLRECSLVVVEQGEGGRCRQLETLREYADDQLTSEERTALKRRHTLHCLALAERAQPELLGRDQSEWLDRLEREHDNLRAALDWAVETGEAELGLRLGRALFLFWLMRCYRTEGLERLVRLLAIPGAATRTTVRAAVQVSAGQLAAQQGDFAVARVLIAESLAIFREHDDKEGIAHALAALGLLFQFQGDWGSARSFREESLMLQRELGDREAMASSLDILGHVALGQGDDEEAHSLFEESLALFQELGQKAGIARSFCGLGLVAESRGDWEAARSLYEEGLAAQQHVGDKSVIAMLLNGLGSVAQHQGDGESARSLYERSLMLSREVGNRLGIARSLNRLGSVARAQGNDELALCHCQESLRLFRDSGHKGGIAACLGELAVLAGAQGQPERAARLLGAAQVLREASSTPLPPGERASYEHNVAVIRVALGEEAFAAAWAAGQAMPLEQAMQHVRGE
jgi:predicted ATPase/DNA-binding SARP family transcriptional activator